MRLPFKYQNHILLLVLLITVVQALFISRLQYDYDIEQLFPKNDPELEFHRQTEQKFAFHEDFLILGIENSDGVFNTDFLLRLDSLIKILDGHPLVRNVNAPTNLRYHYRTPFGIKSSPFIHLNTTSRYQEDSLRLHAYSDVSSKFISRRNTAICSYIFLNEALNDQTKEEVRSFVVEKVAAIGFDKHHLYGDIYVKDSYIKELESEMYWLSGLSLIVIVCILFFSFRSFWGVLIPISIVILTVIWTLGTLAVFNVSINVMTVLIPTIVAILSLSDVIHVMNRCSEQIGVSRQEVIQLAVKDIGMAILLTSVTTGFGFLTLSYSNIQPIIEFGVFTAIGVAYAYLLAIIALPLLLNLVAFDRVKENKFIVVKIIPAAYRFTRRKPGTILFITGFILVLSMFGMSKLKVDSYLYEELSAKDAFSETLYFFEDHLTGIRTFELHLKVADSTLTMLDPEILQQIEILESYLSNEYGLREVYSIGTQVKRSNRVINGGDPEAFVLPGDVRMLNSITAKLLSNKEDLGLQSILSVDTTEGRIVGKIEDLGSAEIRRRNQELTRFIAQNIDSDLLNVQLTGSTLLLDKSNRIITDKLLYGLLFAIVVVSLLMGLLFRSMKITLVAIVPNLLPLLMILGLIGWTGLGLKMSTAIIFTIVFGIAVDDTIHFMSRLNRELKKGHSMLEAVHRTYLSTGKAMLITSLILILGFGVLLFSSFQTTFITGFLVSLALCFALFADLIVLPVLLEKIIK